MAQTRETAFHPSSPHSSSGGGDSYKHDGTPDTRLTAFSPEENSAKSTKLLQTASSGSAQGRPVQFAVKPANGYRGTHIPNVEKDPFITSTAVIQKPEQKLSPTASAFRPFSVPIVVHGSADGPSFAPATAPDHQQPATPLSASFSADLQLSRDLVIFSRPRVITDYDVKTLFANLEHIPTSCYGTRTIHPGKGRILVQFSDIRDAYLVHNNVHQGGPDWRTEYVLSEVDSELFPSSLGRYARHNGIVNVQVIFSPSAKHSIESLEAIVFCLLQTEGDIFAFQRLSFNGRSWNALVEFCDVHSAQNSAAKFKDCLIDGLNISIFPDETDNLAADQAELPGMLATPTTNRPVRDLAAALNGMSLERAQVPRTSVLASAHPATSPASLQICPQFAVYPASHSQLNSNPPYLLEQLPLRSHSTVPLGNNLSLLAPLYPQTISALLPLRGDLNPQRPLLGYGRSDGRRQNAARVSRSPYYNAATHHNHVDVNRIREGIDVRTTIMLRNIPNKVDQAMLKRIVDESSWGKYDFMYLRIDFANDCNVGYAFINFVDPLDIVDFVNARGNQRWNCFKSDKVAEISYATIQGKDCLVQKFRNSSVMLEPPHYRPKLYFTSNGPRPEMAGQEEQFPEPDNQSKMKRSCENAEHVGLFTPNAGQHFRDEQRRRRSQYDRGTRLAALEEYDFDAHIYAGH